MVLLPVAHFGGLGARACKVHVGTLGTLKPIYIYINTLPLGPLWQPLELYGMEAKLSAKAPLAVLTEYGGKSASL